MVDEPLGDDGPEAPWWLKQAQWLAHYLSREGTVIKQAPAAFAASTLISSAVIVFLVYLFMSHEYAQIIVDYTSAKERYEATLKNLQSAIDFDEKRISSMTPNAQQQQLTMGAVSQIRLLNMIRLAPEIPVKVNVYLENFGQLPAIGPIEFGKIIVSQTDIPDSSLDEEFVAFHDKLIDAKSRKINFEIQTKETFFSTIVDNNITADQNNNVKDGKAKMYVLGLVFYRDENTPDGKWRELEFCHFAIANSADHFCNQHNGSKTTD